MGNTWNEVIGVGHWERTVHYSCALAELERQQCGILVMNVNVGGCVDTMCRVALWDETCPEH